MNLHKEEIELINNYIPTLQRYFKDNNNYKYFKSPFVEKFILKFVLLNSDDQIISKIIDKINDNIISNEDIFFSFKTNIILFLIKYYQYFYIINELLYDDNEEELFYCIYIYSKNDENIILNYSKKYFKMKIFFYLIDDLFKIFKKNIDILIKNEILSDENIFKLFIKNIFFNWHIFYKKTLEDESFVNIEKKYEIKKNLLYKMVCSHNLC